MCIRDSIKKASKSDKQKVLTSKEKIQSNGITFAVIVAYCRACTWYMVAMVLFFNVMLHSVSVATNLWLAKWSTANDVRTDSENATFSQVTACDGSGSPKYVQMSS